MTQDERVLSLCRQLVQIPSLSGDERQAAEFLAAELRRGGFDEVAIDRWGSVIGCIHGRRPGGRILLDGHIDTVPAPQPESWHHPPFAGEVEDGRLYGRGTSDMKGGVAAMITAAEAFARESGRNFAGAVYVSCSVQEELFEGVACRETIRNVRPDAVIVGEATSQTLKIGQRGRAEITAVTHGVSCHSSNPEKGVNAVYLMMELLAELRALPPREHPLLGRGILELTDIRSEPYPGASVVPGTCRATFDRRLLVGETEQSVLDELRAAVRRAQGRLPSLRAEIFVAEGENRCWTGETMRAKRFFPAWAMEEDSPLVRRSLRGLRAAGIEAPLSHYAFCTNASAFCGEAGIPTVGFGPSLESLAHTADEYVEIDQLCRAVRGYTAILRALTGDDGGTD